MTSATLIAASTIVNVGRACNCALVEICCGRIALSLRCRHGIVSNNRACTCTWRCKICSNRFRKHRYLAHCKRNAEKGWATIRQRSKLIANRNLRTHARDNALRCNQDQAIALLNSLGVFDEWNLDCHNAVDLNRFHTKGTVAKLGMAVNVPESRH